VIFRGLLRIGIRKERSADPMTRMAVVDAGHSPLHLLWKVFLPLRVKTITLLSCLFNNLLTVILQTIMAVMVDGCTKDFSMSANMVSSKKTIIPVIPIEDFLAASQIGSLSTRNISKISDTERMMVELMKR